MSITEPTPRFCTRAAIDGLAARLNLRNAKEIQDWEYEVADPDRLAEFLAVYQSAELSEDEKFCLMEIVIESFEELESDNKYLKYWPTIEEALLKNFRIHAYTAWYWSCFDAALKDAWVVSSKMRQIFSSR